MSESPQVELVVPLAVWTLETGNDGLFGIYDNESAAKSEAERIARKALRWDRFMGNGLVALHNESEPETSDAYFVTMHGVCSAPGQRDPLNDGTAAASEPIEDPELAAGIYRVLAHQLNHGIGNAEDCPACDVSPNPFCAEGSDPR